MITCMFEDNAEAKLRHAVADVIVLNNSNQILLVKRALHIKEGGKFGLVGGFVDRNETVTQTVVREVLEETGYNCRIDYFLRIKDSPDRPNDAERQNISFVFVVHALEKVGIPDNESTEQTWFDLDKLPSKDQMAFDHFDDIQYYLSNPANPTACNRLISIP